jgi:uncharacterized protein (TIGR00255 family)
MPRSMTGFGRAEIKNEKYEITAEIRNLNNRYLDINLRLPKSLSAYEFSLKELFKKKVARGKLTININFTDLLLANGNFVLNEESVRFYYNLLNQIKKQTGVEGEITLDHLLQFKELIAPEEYVREDEEISTLLLKVVDEALENLNEMRSKEAENIGSDIIYRVNLIDKTVQEINEKGKENPRAELRKLSDRLKELVNSHEINENRLEMELALLADRVDITEECIRLKSHVALFLEVFETKEEVGKQLTFILQEMQRESNTIGSKTTDVSISHLIISMKEEIEKIREQVQNLE